MRVTYDSMGITYESFNCAAEDIIDAVMPAAERIKREEILSNAEVCSLLHYVANWIHDYLADNS